MDKANISHVELAYDEKPLSKPTGLVALYKGDQLVLIPTPSPDPRGTSSTHFFFESYFDELQIH